MRSFFSPAVALMNRLAYPKKFTLLGLMFLIAIAILAASLFASLNAVIRTSQRQLEAILLIQPVASTIQAIQQHRGFSSALLNGNEAMRDMRAVKEKKATEAFDILEEKLPPVLRQSENWRNIRANWESLRKEGLNWTVAENFDAHTELIHRLINFEIAYAQNPEVEHLLHISLNRLPEILEHMGQIRGYATGVLAEKRITETQKKTLYGMIANLDDNLLPLKIGFDKAAHHNPALRSPLLAASGDISNSATRIIHLVESDILTGHLTTAPEDFMTLTTTEIDNGYSHMYASLLPATEVLIRKRIAQAENVLYISVGVAFLLFMVVIYFLAGIYYATIGNIQSLARSAHAFAGGDLRARVQLDTRDVLSRVGDSFNEMADGFSAMLEARKQAEDALHKSKDLLLSVVENAPVRIFWKDRASRYLGCNTQFAKDAGRSSPDELIGNTDFDMGWKDQAELYRADDQAVMESGKPKLGFEEPQTTPDGNTIWLRTSKVPLLDKNSQVIGILGIYEDISERKQAAQALRDSHEELDHLLNSLVEGVYGVDTDGNCTFVNQSFLQMLGYQHENEVMGKNMHELIHHAHADGSPYVVSECKIYRAYQTNQLVNVADEMFWRKDGVAIPVEYWSRPIETNGVVTGSIVTFIDITGRKKAEEDINRLAFYDPLTNLPNRRLLLDRLQQAMAVSTRSGRYGALLYLDLDNFKIINDTQGHAMGDLLLTEAARRLQSCVRQGDSVARLGGDEFVLVLEELSPQQDEAVAQAELIAEKIRDELSQPYMLKGYEHHTTASIGISLFSDHLENAEGLLRYADIAMYEAKTAGRNAIRFFDPQMQAILDKRAAIEKDLRQALARQQFRLYYQIQVDSLRRPLGAEVLLRWQHPERGFVFPDQFIPLAEDTGLIVPIGLWTLETVCAQLRDWQQNALTRDLTLAVNVSAKQFHQADFVAQVQRVLLESGAKPSLLKLELTESTVLEDVDDTIAKMREIKMLGVSFSMDDFGTGYSSLQYLKRLPLDQIKIDRSFVLDITSDPNDAAIVQAIIVMSKALGLNVIAEGVETEAQRDFLDKHDCHAFQGYLYGKPVPLGEFEALLNQG